MIKQPLTKKKVLFFLLSICFLSFVSCSSEDDDYEPAHAGLNGDKIIIENIQWLTAKVEFDHVEVKVIGNEWQALTTIKGNYDGVSAVLELPVSIPSESLQLCQYDADKYGQYYWPAGAISTNPLTGVAALGDFIAYNGEKAVGRVYLSDWSGEGSSIDKAFVYYHYAESAYSLSGFNKSYSYSANFEPGWNAYANIDSSSIACCTTDVPESEELQWRFEVW